MPKGFRRPLLQTMLSALLLAGCSLPKPVSLTPATKPQELPAHVAGTVAEHARLSGGSEVFVQGYGLIVGLGNNGSGEVPPYLRQYFSQYLAKRKLLPRSSETRELTLQKILSDPDTAVVEVRGTIPPGAAPGKRFDVFVSALPQTQTRSLDGGVLLPTELYFSVLGPTTAKRSKALAEAEGPIFVNPFLDPNVPGDLAKFRHGRVIGGGEVKEGRTYRLQLRQADYQLCNLLRDRINERFGGGERIATANNPAAIELRVPHVYSEEHESFLRLIMHLPLSRAPGALEAKAMDTASAISSAGANHEDLALVWEAIGRQVLPTVRKFYSSPNHLCAFYAGRTGARMADAGGTEVLIRFAKRDGSPLQVQAIEELGKGRRSSAAVAALQPLVDHDNELVRVAAYESLLKQGDSSKVTRLAIKDQFNVDVVASTRNHVVYASQTAEPKLVLFGKDIEILRPMFFNAPDDLVTIHGEANADRLTVIRRIPRTGGVSEPFSVEANVRSLVTTLGTLPTQRSDQKRAGLGLTYGQVVSVLYRICKEGDIRAEFRLQPLPDVRRIYRDMVTVGRPDTPGS
jgi:flagellar basal body P-ring protein FlgI